ncbi:MAG: hypothetical protein ACRYF2_01860 [Janthinobacterium lividum]
MHQADSSERMEGPGSRIEDPWAGFRRQLRVRNILLSIVAIEALTFDALRW